MTRKFHWEEFINEVSKQVPPQQFRAWLESVRFVELNEKELILATPTDFSRNWIKDHYEALFVEILSHHFGIDLEVKVIISDETMLEIGTDSAALLTMPLNTVNSPSNDFSETQAPSSSNSSELTLGIPKPSHSNSDFDHSAQESDGHAAYSSEPVAALSVKDLITPVIRTIGESLNPKHTFETFVVGASNQFAHAAARAVAEQPASQYNPLFIFSHAGLGKTHLLHAIGNHVLRKNPKSKICYISAERFVNELIEAIRHERMSQFRQKYRDGYDMLLIDDIQFIAGKGRSQEEFFHTFNTLHSTQRQIVVTSDKFPKDIPGLEDRIRTRFEWGLIADIQPPEIETRIAILRAKAEMDDLFLPNDVALFLASNIKSNVRELEGSLIKLSAQASLLGVEISLDLAKRELSNLIRQPTETLSPDFILQSVADHFMIKVQDLKSKERSRKYSFPRQISMFLLRKYCDKSYPDIGVILGGKDHSTVLHGVKTIQAELDSNPEIRRHVEEIQNTF